jgi:hypothetical protein
MDATQPALEVQEALLRFTTQFADRVTQATETLERTSPPGIRDEALRKNILYVSSALEIAAGPEPDVNLLDMIVFIRLSRAVLERHWIPEVYGERGAALAEVFDRSERDLQAIAERALTPAQRAELGNVVDTWLEENPDQIRVEGVRLADFAAAAGSAASARAGKAKGLLSSMTMASRAANQALLLAERGLFLVHRLPFLWRLHARLGARDIIADAVASLSEGPDAPITKVVGRTRHLARRGAVYAGVLLGLGGLLWLSGSRARA